MNDDIIDIIATEQPTEKYTTKIKVLGVGGVGSNTAEFMHKNNIECVDYIICNTDKQALDNVTSIPIKVQLGKDLTKGEGAGNNPERGRQSAIESIEEIKELIADANMVFITAGMGGGTGTGAAPEIAKAAMSMGILTVGAVTIPYKLEGKQKISQAINGLREMSNNVDALLVINAERIIEIYGDAPIDEALMKAGEMLGTAIQGIAEIITQFSNVANVDFADVRTALTQSGVALFGIGRSSGPNRHINAIKEAMSSKLLNNNSIYGAKYIIVNIFMSKQKKVSLKECYAILTYASRLAGINEKQIIWGAGFDDSLGDDVKVTIIATGFAKSIFSHGEDTQSLKKIFTTDDSDTIVRETITEDEPNDDEQPRTISDNDIDIDYQTLYEKVYVNPMSEELILNDLLPVETRTLYDLRMPEVRDDLNMQPAFVRRNRKENDKPKIPTDNNNY